MATNTHAADWHAIWTAGVEQGTGFDVGGTHKALAEMEPTLPLGRALVPGCGRGYDVAALAQPLRKVTGLELSPEAATRAGEYLARVAAEELLKVNQMEVLVADFFEYKAQPYDLVYDYTFLCAIRPERREEWSTQMARLLRPGGKLVCLMFPLGHYGLTHPAGEPIDWTKGPPFMLSRSSRV